MTLEVLKLSGWLNDDARCRESKERRTVWYYLGQQAGGGGRPRCMRGVQGRARLQIGSRVRGGAHEEHAVHVCDAGCVEAQRLVERIRGLPSWMQSIQSGTRCRTEGGRAWGR